MALHAATVGILIEKSKFERDVALGVAEAIDLAMTQAQFVTVPLLDARLYEIKTELRVLGEKVDAKLDASAYKADMQRFAAEFNAKLDTKLAELNVKVDMKLAEFSAKFDTKFAELEARLDTKLAEFEAKLAAKLAEFEAKLAAVGLCGHAGKCRAESCRQPGSARIQVIVGVRCSGFSLCVSRALSSRLPDAPWAAEQWTITLCCCMQRDVNVWLGPT